MTDPAVADHAAPGRPSRRALLGAGVVGAVLAAAASRTASASSGLSDDDLELVERAIGMELAIRDLYDVALEQDDDELWKTLSKQHESYAQLLAGIAGVSADTRDDELYDRYASEFGSSDPTPTALAVENEAAATHVELIGEVDDLGAVGAMASITTIESRQATLLASLSTPDDVEALLVNPLLSEA